MLREYAGGFQLTRSQFIGGLHLDHSKGLLMTQMYGLAAYRKRILQGNRSRRYVSGLFGQHAGCGLDGNTQAPLVSLADRLSIGAI